METIWQMEKKERDRLNQMKEQIPWIRPQRHNQCYRATKYEGVQKTYYGNLISDKLNMIFTDVRYIPDNPSDKNVQNLKETSLLDIKKITLNEQFDLEEIRAEALSVKVTGKRIHVNIISLY